jgi:hypothetical protein
MANQQGGMDSSRRNAIIIVAVLAVIVIVFVLLNRGGGDAPADATPTPDNSAQGVDEEGFAIADLVVGESINADGCVTNISSSFDDGDTIYIGIGPSTFPEGTVFYAQFFVDGNLYEETNEITADDDYVDTCVQFNIQAEDGSPLLESGDYEANFLINGNVADSVTFIVE